MSALFALLRQGQELDDFLDCGELKESLGSGELEESLGSGELEEFLGSERSVRAAAEQATLRRYPEACDRHHLFSLVRDARDPHATRWLRGLLLAIATGAVVGTIINAVLSLAFDMFGGLASIAIPLGFLLGAFLGAFTALMTGTHKPRPDLRPLLNQAQPGDILLQWSTPERAILQHLRSHCQATSTPHILLD
jgi:hypothetical protein